MVKKKKENQAQGIKTKKKNVMLPFPSKNRTYSDL